MFFLHMHLFSNKLSSMITSWLIMSELLPACLSCSNNLNLSQKSLGSDDKKLLLKDQKQKSLNLVFQVIL